MLVSYQGDAIPSQRDSSAHQAQGFGLATAYGIVKQSGGYIKVLSAPGKGA